MPVLFKPEHDDPDEILVYVCNEWLWLRVGHVVMTKDARSFPVVSIKYGSGFHTLVGPDGQFCTEEEVEGFYEVDRT